MRWWHVPRRYVRHEHELKRCCCEKKSWAALHRAARSVSSTLCGLSTVMLLAALVGRAGESTLKRTVDRSKN